MKKREIEKTAKTAKETRMRRLFFRRPDGSLPSGTTVALALALVCAAYFLAGFALSALTSLMLSLWGVTDATYPYAPGWLRLCLTRYALIDISIRFAACSLAAYIACRIAKKTPLPGRNRHLAWGMLIGFFSALFCYAILRLTDSVRTLPGQGASALNEGLYIAAIGSRAWAIETLVGGVFWPNLRKRFSRPMLAFALCVPINALSWLITGAFEPKALLCEVAMALVCCALYERGSFRAAAGFRFAWSVAAYRAFGFSVAGGAGLWIETFPVAKDWLTGGDAGLEAGLLAAALFLLYATALLIRQKRPIAGSNKVKPEDDRIV